MSGKVVGLVFDHYSGNGSELLLAVKLADNAHDDGTHIFPSVATLARQTRQSERTVQYQLKRMVEARWLILVRKAIGGGRGGAPGRPNEYRINPDFIKAFDTRTPESERPMWPPQPVGRQNPDGQEMGADSAPISSGKRVQSGKEMGATAVAEMGAIAVAPEPSLTVNKNTPLPPTGGAPGFEAVNAEYPRQTAKAKALAVWTRINPDAQTQQAMLQAIRAWRRTQEWQREEGRYVPLLWKWLRDGRWRDVPGIADPPASSAPPPVAPADEPAAKPSLEVRARMEAILASAGRRSKKNGVECGENRVGEEAVGELGILEGAI